MLLLVVVETDGGRGYLREREGEFGKEGEEISNDRGRIEIIGRDREREREQGEGDINTFQNCH